MQGNNVLLELLILMAFASLSWEFCQRQYMSMDGLKCNSLEWSELNDYGTPPEIYIENSYIYEIEPSTFRRYQNLIKLSMPGNNITVLQPGSFSGLGELSFLNLSTNNIQIISKGVLNHLYNLKILDLSNNFIDTIESLSFSGTDRLRSLYLHNNKLIRVPDLRNESVNLELIDISNNEIQKLALNKLSSTIRSLRISGNVLGSVSVEDFASLPQLRVLSLSRNTLFDKNNLPIGLFQNIMLLERLNLSATAIRKISIGSFSGLRNLEILDLSSNNLEFLPNGLFHELKSLAELDVSNNQLSTFQYDGFSKLSRIGLDKNHWKCDSLSVIIHNLKGTTITLGNTFNTTNLFGIECFEEEQNTTTYNSSEVSLERQFLSKITKMQETSENLLSKITDIFQLLRNDTSVIAMIEKENKDTLTDIRNGLSSKVEMQKSAAALSAIHFQPTQPYKTSSTNGGSTAALYGIFVLLLTILLVILFTLYRRHKHVSHNYDEGNPLHSLRV